MFSYTFSVSIWRVAVRCRTGEFSINKVDPENKQIQKQISTSFDSVA